MANRFDYEARLRALAALDHARWRGEDARDAIGLRNTLLHGASWSDCASEDDAVARCIAIIDAKLKVLAGVRSAMESARAILAGVDDER